MAEWSVKVLSWVLVVAVVVLAPVWYSLAGVVFVAFTMGTMHRPGANVYAIGPWIFLIVVWPWVVAYTAGRMLSPVLGRLLDD